MSTTLPTAAAMANVAAAAIGLPTPLVRLDLNGLVVISSGRLVSFLVAGWWLGVVVVPRDCWCNWRAFEHHSHQRGCQQLG